MDWAYTRIFLTEIMIVGGLGIHLLFVPEVSWPTHDQYFDDLPLIAAVQGELWKLGGFDLVSDPSLCSNRYIQISMHPNVHASMHATN